ncbi:MAG TPA: leucyl aminopeptidase family protein [Stellaceae bacterium]|jgi:leucyl aminopeptidase|nr:leucyl aminopeptidase family protein [Stellaceae bacterium]
MAYSLIDQESGAVPLTPLSKTELAGWRETAPVHERDWVAAVGFKAEPGKMALLPDKHGKLGRVLVGVGDSEAAMWCVAGLSETLPEGSYRLDPVSPVDPSRVALGWALGTYAFTRYHAKPAGAARLVWPDGTDRKLVERLAGAVFLARDLAVTPASDMGPAELAEAAEKVAKAEGAHCRIVVGDELLAKNYPTIHAVGRASTRPPRLVDITWGEESAPKVTLVGKGVCFDTGGLDIKPASGMLNMKKDMAGAAIMLGLGQAIIQAGLKVRLRVLLPCVENSVAGNAMRPRDIIKTRKGLTVEIGNTDAEGRLILCDALSEASDEKPEMIVDAATLTGAARVALGPELPALFCNNDALAYALLAAGEAEDDPMWRMPLYKPYRRLIDSKIADLNNVSDGPQGGAITAALYLNEFVDPAVPWAHLDVLAWNNRSRPGRPEGAEAQTLRAVYANIADRFG